MSIAARGNDLTALGTDDVLDWCENKLKYSCEVYVRGRVGEECAGPQEA